MEKMQPTAAVVGERLTCIVTRRSSTMTSFVRKSAPIVALYWLLNFLFTYWFMREVFPTLTTQDREETKVILNLNTAKVVVFQCTHRIILPTYTELIFHLSFLTQQLIVSLAIQTAAAGFLHLYPSLPKLILLPG